MITTDTPRRAKEDLAHARSVEPRFADIVKFLSENLGPAVTAYIADRNVQQVQRWAKAKTEPRNHDIERRLRAAYQIFTLLGEDNSPHVVRAWFIGMNPQLDDEAPAEVLLANNAREVMAAAKAFQAGG